MFENTKHSQKILVFGLLLVTLPLLFSLFLVRQLSHNIEDLRNGITTQMLIEQIGENTKVYALTKKLDPNYQFISESFVQKLEAMNDHFFSKLEATQRLDKKEMEYLLILKKHWQNLRTKPDIITPSLIENVNKYDSLLVDHEKLKMSVKEPKVIKSTSFILTIMSMISLLAVVIMIYAVYFLFKDSEYKKNLLSELTESREKALAASRLKSQFLAIVSHELRTPLNGIIGVSDLLRRKLVQTEHFSQANIIFNSGKTLLRIINDILDFSKFETKQVHIEIAPFDIRSVISQVIDTLSHKAKTKSLNLNYSIDRTIPTLLRGDGDRLAQVLFNLIGNAIKFTERGHIDIQVKLASTDEDISVLHFLIHDTGLGMTEDELSTLFVPFTQFQKQGTSGEAGTGLGLSITKYLLNLMSGDIEIRSEKDFGTKIKLTIPFEIEKTIEAKLDQQDIEKHYDNFKFQRSLRVLVVEDNTTNQIISQALLEQMGADVTTANDGKEALHLCRENTFDLIFMDCQMPIMDGFEATIELRKNGVKTPIIAMTASALQKDKDHCLKVGMSGFISKPILMHTIYHEAHRVLNENQNLIQKNKLDILISQIGKTSVEKVLKNFQLNLMEFEETVYQGIQQRNQESLKKSAHKLKSSSLMIGADLFSNDCENIEESSSLDEALKNSQKALGKVKPMSTEIETLLDEIKSSTQAT